jgi:sterol 3beta-glucosyltransferase/vancomycin aglycone glucosyltransferase
VRVGIQTWGTEGDVRPFFALAHELVARGHEVDLRYSNVEGRDFTALGKACGFRARAVGQQHYIDNFEELRDFTVRLFHAVNPFRAMHDLLDVMLQPASDAMYESGQELAETSDVVITHFCAHPTATAVHARNVPFVTVGFAPLFPSKGIPPPGAPDLGSFLNPLQWRVAAAVLDSALRDRVNVYRGRSGLPPIKNLMETILEHASLALICMSPVLFPRPDEWHPRAQISGFLSMPESAEPWEPEPALAAFLEKGPPVFASFGSMFSFGGKITKDAVDNIAEATRIARARCIIQAPKEIIEGAPRRDDLFYIERAPHARLFPRCSVIVHHGGAGTTQSTALAGKPHVIVPHTADQYFWGDVLRARGVAPAPHARRSMSPYKLAMRIHEAVKSEQMAARAKELRSKMAEENGPRLACEHIEDVVARHSKRE